MGLDLLGEVVRGQVEAEWEGHAPGLDLGGSVYAHVAEPRSFIKPGFAVIV